MNIFIVKGSKFDIVERDFDWEEVNVCCKF